MKRADPIIDMSAAQKILRIEIMRLELAGYGLAIVSEKWLARRRVPERVEALEGLR